MAFFRWPRLGRALVARRGWTRSRDKRGCQLPCRGRADMPRSPRTADAPTACPCRNHIVGYRAREPRLRDDNVDRIHLEEFRLVDHEQRLDGDKVQHTRALVGDGLPHFPIFEHASNAKAWPATSALVLHSVIRPSLFNNATTSSSEAERPRPAITINAARASARRMRVFGYQTQYALFQGNGPDPYRWTVAHGEIGRALPEAAVFALVDVEPHDDQAA
jgi:hypothetical protein